MIPLQRFFVEPSNWAAVLVRGLIAILIGGYIVVRPAGFAQFVTLVLAGYILVGSVVALAAAVRLRGPSRRRSLLVLRGVLGILIGALAIALPFLFARVAWTAMLYLVAMQLLVSGLIELAGSLELRREGLRAGPSLGRALITLGLSAFLFFAPLAIGMTVLRMLGLVILIYGILAIVVGTRARRSVE